MMPLAVIPQSVSPRLATRGSGGAGAAWIRSESPASGPKLSGCSASQMADWLVSRLRAAAAFYFTFGKSEKETKMEVGISAAHSESHMPLGRCAKSMN